MGEEKRRGRTRHKGLVKKTETEGREKKKLLKSKRRKRRGVWRQNEGVKGM